MGRIIHYGTPDRVVVGIPFTWGLCNAWAIKVEGGEMYYLKNGARVIESEEEIIPSVKYATRLEVE